MKIKFTKPSEDLFILNSVGAPIDNYNDWDNIPDPVPAKRIIPDWFKAAPSLDSSSNLVKTVKKCPPFLDALTTGYIIPFCDQVTLKINSNKQIIRSGPGTVFTSIHSKNQYETSPWKDKMIVKFSSPWVIETPAGWSCLFIHPLNDDNSNYKTLAGIVDTDTYRLPVNFPFVVTAEPGCEFTLTKSTPMVQVIPFFRAEWDMEVDNTDIKQWLAHQSLLGNQWETEGYKEHYHCKKKFN